MTDEGYIKFECEWEKARAFSNTKIDLLLQCRQSLYDHNLIGSYPDGIGFGNISIRESGNRFYISGTQTGSLPKLTQDHITLVTDFDFEENSLSCCGPIKASSESLTHAALYSSSNNVSAVVHVHSKNLWDKYLNQLPTTSELIPYGTPEMAYAIMQLGQELHEENSRIIIMGGHPEGIISFGESIQKVTDQLIELT
ncbi:MAG: class II aldolase/adducin family protein [Deltaproteobacteria bacterium]|nr:class II aldolase/adducin family protein [Deltaproteobacteria bacterium]